MKKSLKKVNKFKMLINKESVKQHHAECQKKVKKSCWLLIMDLLY